MSFTVASYSWPAFMNRKPFDHQRKTVRFMLANPRGFILNDMGCVDADTEFLSPTGWKRIADYNGEQVAQWDPSTYKIDFVAPSEFVKKPCDEFIEFANLMTLSPEHRVVGKFKGIHGVKSAAEVAIGSQVELYRTFEAPDRLGLPYTDEVLRVIVAYIADGSIRDGKMYVRLKLTDKIDRMRLLLNDSKLPYYEQSYESDGKTNFIFVPPILTQEFGPEFFNCSKRQLEVICDEVWRWDGRRFLNRHMRWEFSTMKKVSADFIQYAFSALGYKANISVSTKTYTYQAKNPRTRTYDEQTSMYIVGATMYKDATEFSAGNRIVRSKDGFKYCFTVPKTFWLMRSHNKILVTGNTGKTLSALWTCDILLEARKIRRILVISPLSTIKSVWATEIYRNIPHRSYGIAHGTRQRRLDVLKSTAQFVIINHDGIKSVEDEIIATGFDAIIIDELTAFKSNSDRTKCMERIARTVRAVWGMTGDLTPNSPMEAFYPAKIVNPSSKYLPRYYGVFRDACMYPVNEMLWLPKPEAPQIVTMCVQPSIRFTRDQCLDLPDTTYQVLDVELTPEQVQYYNAMRKEAMIESDSGAITAVNAAVKLNKLLQISAGAVKNDVGDVVEIGCQPRLDMLLELFEETPQRKMVVFATYKATIAMLVRELTKRGIAVANIDGDVHQNLRASHIDRFQHGDLQVLVLQPQSSAHGITLTASSTVVWFSLIPSNELFQQGNARIVRAGQTRKTFVYMMVSTKAEQHIAKILENKGRMSEEILRLFTDHDL